MSGSVGVKIRKVRCPKCKLILEEPTDVRVYQCGCCHTFLEAKVRTSDAGNTLPSSGELDASQVNKGLHVTKDKPADKALDAGESSVDQNGGTDLVRYDDRNGGQLSYDLKSTSIDHSDVDGHDESGELDGDLISSIQKLNIEKDDSKLGGSNDEQIGCVQFSNEDPEKNSDESETCHHRVGQPGIYNEASSSNGFGEANNEKMFSVTREQGDVALNIDSADNQSTLKIDESDTCNHNAEQPEASSSKEFGEGKNEEIIVLSGKQDDVALNGDGSRSAILDANNQSIRKLDETDGMPLSISSHKNPAEDILPDSPPLSSSEQPHEDGQNIRNLDKFGDSSGTIGFVNPSSELSSTLVDLTKSPATRSTQAYYGDDISSNDGTDDQLFDRRRYLFSSSHKPANLVASNERPRREKLVVNRDSEMRHHSKDHPSAFSDQMHDANRIKWFDRGRVYNPERAVHPPDQWRRLEDGSPSRAPFNHNEFSAGYESSIPSYQLHDEYQWKSSFNQNDKMLYLMEEEARLLRMGCELQEQFNTRYCPNEIANEQVSAGAEWKGRHIPMFYSREAVEKHEHNSEPAQIPLLRHVTNMRQQVDWSGCCWSEDSALPFTRNCPHERGHCRIHSGVRSYNEHGSWSSSPEPRMDFLPPVDIRGSKSDDQGDRGYGMNGHKKKKQPLVKRYLRPIAGAAPFISCSFCMKQLQLPAGFFLLGKRCHRLKCGACGEVHKFSLINQSHLVPYTPVLQAPPPSEVDEFTDSARWSQMASSSDVHGLPQEDPVSFSDENARKVSHSSLGNGERGQKFVSSDSKNKFGYLDQTSGSFRRSSEMSMSNRILSKNVDRAIRGRPLHHLMGYSSPEQVLFGRGGASSSCSSSQHQGELSAEEP